MALQLAWNGKIMMGSKPFYRDVLRMLPDALVAAGFPECAVELLNSIIHEMDADKHQNNEHKVFVLCMKGKLASIQASIIREACRNHTVCDEEQDKIQRLFQESRDGLLFFGYDRAALNLAIKQAQFLADSEHRCIEKIQHYHYFLEGYTLLKNSVETGDRMLDNIKKELGHQIDLPLLAEKEVLNVKIQYASFCLDMVELWVKEKQDYDVQQRSKHPTLRVSVCKLHITGFALFRLGLLANS